MMMEILYAAAHAEFPDTEPLGGGKAVADYLIRHHPEWRVLSPARFGLDGRLTEMSERRYAKFCREFERATTAEILRHDPRQCVVLTNDISEGPDFAVLKDYRIVSLWHVDVVEYFTKFYLCDLIRPETAAKWVPWPRLVFRKQRDCVRYSTRIVVPSAPMKEMIRRCYPWCDAGRIEVLPWGDVAASPAVAPYPADGFIIMTLSRLSPEKGIERLLKALRYVEEDVRVWIGGAAAYMKGRRYERRLWEMADKRVEFIGHVTGQEKAARLARADVFVSPSRHESFGLTIAEAEAAGCRVISHSHYGAAGRVVDCSQPRELARVISELIKAGRTVRRPQVVRTEEPTAVRIARICFETMEMPRDGQPGQKKLAVRVNACY
jgi:glycosyltransferase involved in cell wall biosynthesis